MRHREAHLRRELLARDPCDHCGSIHDDDLVVHQRWYGFDLHVLVNKKKAKYEHKDEQIILKTGTTHHEILRPDVLHHGYGIACHVMIRKNANPEIWLGPRQLDKLVGNLKGPNQYESNHSTHKPAETNKYTYILD